VITNVEEYLAALTADQVAETVNRAATTESRRLIAANPLRTGLIIHNDSDEVLYIRYGTEDASTDVFSEAIAPRSTLRILRSYAEMVKTEVHHIVATGTARVMVTELRLKENPNR